MEHAHAQAPPVGAVLGGESIHGRVGAEPGEQPLAVGHGAEAEHVLVAALLDRLPGGAAAGFALAGRPHLEFGLEPGGELLGGQAGEARDQPVGRQDQRPGSLMPTSIIRQKLAGSSWPDGLAGLRPARRGTSARSRSGGGRRR